jgi:hypothetical protein
LFLKNCLNEKSGPAGILQKAIDIQRVFMQIFLSRVLFNLSVKRVLMFIGQLLDSILHFFITHEEQLDLDV